MPTWFKVIILALVISAGGSYALAVWTDPLGAPTNCPDTIFGCNEPINASSVDQQKAGGLQVDGLLNTLDKLLVGPITEFITPDGPELFDVDGAVRIREGAARTGTANGYVLKSDANGLATWQNPAADNFWKATTTSGSLPNDTTDIDRKNGQVIIGQLAPLPPAKARLAAGDDGATTIGVYGYGGLGGLRGLSSGGSGTYGVYALVSTTGAGGFGSNASYNLLEGNLGVGLPSGGANPDVRLVVRGASTGTGQAVLVKDFNNLDLFKILDNGNIGINTPGNPNDRLEVNGNIRLPATSSSGSVGVIKINGLNFIHAYIGSGSEPNTFVGMSAGKIGVAHTGARNTGLGFGIMGYLGSGSSNLTGSRNTGVGSQALFDISSGSSNTAVGVDSMLAVGAAASSTAIGASAMMQSGVGSNNVAVGAAALMASGGGGSNVAVGSEALRSGTGNNNVAVGYQAGYGASNAVTSGSSNTFLGSRTGFFSSTQRTKSVAIGYNAKVDANNAMVLGGIGADAVSVGIGTMIPGQVLDVYGGNGRVQAGFSWLTSSDLRLKKNVSTLSGVLDNLKDLRGVRYDLREDGATAGQGKYIGFIAQELEKEFPEVVIVDEKGYRSVDYGRMTAVLLQAIKEQQAEIEELKKKLDA
ncbi:MAG: tail fiber domain-containing protein [Patescibacteria group bacterium]